MTTTPSDQVPQPADDEAAALLELDDPAELAARLGPASRRLVLLDFDGVLSHIVDHPDQAVATTGALDAVRALAARTTVAVVSGRPIDDLRSRLPELSVTLAGAHGAELVHADGTPDHLADPASMTGVLDELEDDIRGLVDAEPGWLVERKATSLAVHHRLAPPASVDELLPRVRATLEHRTDAGPGFAVLAGKAVLELRPDGVDKGLALERIAARAPSLVPLVVGDDVTDEDAFAVAVARGGDAVLVADDPRPTAATSRLRDPDVVTVFLDALVGTEAG